MKKKIKTICVTLLIVIQVVALVFLFLQIFQVIQNKYISIFAYSSFFIGSIYTFYIGRKYKKNSNR